MMDPNALMEMGTTGALVAVVLAAFKALESKRHKKSGGDICSRLTLLEEKVKSIDDSVSDFRSDFTAFREEALVIWARRQAREETLREVKHGKG